jgi:hypothetical protein
MNGGTPSVPNIRRGVDYVIHGHHVRSSIFEVYHSCEARQVQHNNVQHIRAKH